MDIEKLISQNVKIAMDLAKENNLLETLKGYKDDIKCSQGFLQFLYSHLINGVWAESFLPIFTSCLMFEIAKQANVSFAGICPHYSIDLEKSKQYCWALGFSEKKFPLQCYCMPPQTIPCFFRALRLSGTIFWTPTITFVLPK